MSAPQRSCIYIQFQIPKRTLSVRALRPRAKMATDKNKGFIYVLLTFCEHQVIAAQNFGLLSALLSG
jgi:hypothetical protein